MHFSKVYNETLDKWKKIWRKQLDSGLSEMLAKEEKRFQNNKQLKLSLYPIITAVDKETLLNMMINVSICTIQYTILLTNHHTFTICINKLLMREFIRTQ